MENTVVEEQKSVPEKIIAAPVNAGTAVVTGIETVGHDLAKGTWNAATIVVDGTKTVVRVIIESGETLGRDAKLAVSPAETIPPAAAIAPAA